MVTLEPEIALDDVRIDVGAGEKRQHDGAEAGDVIDPGRERQADGVAGDGADHDLEQGGRDVIHSEPKAAANASADPQRRLKPDIVHLTSLSVVPHGHKKTRAAAGHEKPPPQSHCGRGHQLW